jgi:hypothetical protein
MVISQNLNSSRQLSLVVSSRRLSDSSGRALNESLTAGKLCIVVAYAYC